MPLSTFVVCTAQVQDQISKRGIRTVTGLGRFYRKHDTYNTGVLDQYDLEKGLKTFHINLEPQVKSICPKGPVFFRICNIFKVLIDDIE